MLSSKIICNDMYSNKSWCIVGQGMFTLQEIDQMEQVMCSYWAKGSLGHHLFILAFMLSSKIICDDTYSNKSWCIVGQGMFALWEIDQMEQVMCSY